MYDIKATIESKALTLWQNQELKGVLDIQKQDGGAKWLSLPGGGRVKVSRKELTTLCQKLTGRVWQKRSLNSLKDLENFLSLGYVETQITALTAKNLWSSQDRQRAHALANFFEEGSVNTNYVQLTDRIFEEYVKKETTDDPRLQNLTDDLRGATLRSDPTEPNWTAVVSYQDKQAAQLAITEIANLKREVDNVLSPERAPQSKKYRMPVARHLTEKNYEKLRLLGANICNQHLGSRIHKHVVHAVSRLLTPLRKAVAAEGIRKHIPQLAASQGTLRSGLWAFNQRMKKNKWKEQLAALELPTFTMKGHSLCKWLKDQDKNLKGTDKYDWLMARSEGLYVDTQGTLILAKWLGASPNLPNDDFDPVRDRWVFNRQERRNGWEQDIAALQSEEHISYREPKGHPLTKWLTIRSGRAIDTERYEWLLNRSKGLYITGDSVKWLEEWLKLDAKSSEDQLEDSYDNICGAFLTASKNKTLPDWEGVAWYNAENREKQKTLAPEREGLILNAPASARIGEDSQLVNDVINVLYPNRKEFPAIYRTHGLICRLYSPYSFTWDELRDQHLEKRLFHNPPMHLWQAAAIASELGLSNVGATTLNFEVVPPRPFQGFRFDFTVRNERKTDQSYKSLITHHLKGSKIIDVHAWRTTRKLKLKSKPPKDKCSLSNKPKPPVRAWATFSETKELQKLTTDGLARLLSYSWWASYSNYAFALPPTNSVVKHATPLRQGVVKKAVQLVIPKSWTWSWELETFFPCQLAPLKLPQSNCKETRKQWGAFAVSNPRQQSLTEWANRWDAPARAGLTDAQQKGLHSELRPWLSVDPRCKLASTQQAQLTSKNATDATMNGLHKSWNTWLLQNGPSLWKFIKEHGILPKSARKTIASQLFPRLTHDRLDALTKRIEARAQLFGKKGLEKISLQDVYYAHYPDLAKCYTALNQDLLSPFGLSQLSLEDTMKRRHHPPKVLQSLIEKEAPLYRFKS